MATTTTRIKDIPTTATTAASDDYFMVDGATNGTRKYAHNADPAAHATQIAAAVAGLKAHWEMSLASLGDSLSALNSPVISGGISWVSIGSAVTRARVRYREDHNFAVAGKTSTEIRAEQLPMALACNSKYVTVLAGTNNQEQVATVISDIAYICTAILSNGQTPVLATLPPRNGMVAQSVLDWCAINTWIRSHWATDSRIIGVDLAAACLAPQTAFDSAPAWISGLNIDNVHPGWNGIWVMGAALGEALNATNLGPFPGPASAGDGDDPVSGIGNPMMLGSAGPKNWGTGNLADLWDSDYSENSQDPVSTFQKFARTDGLPGVWQGVTAAPTDTSIRIRARNAASADSTWVAGKSYHLFIEAKYDVAIDTLFGAAAVKHVFFLFDGTPAPVYAIAAHVPGTSVNRGKTVVYNCRITIPAGTDTTGWSLKVYPAPYPVANGLLIGRVWRELIA